MRCLTAELKENSAAEHERLQTKIEQLEAKVNDLEKQLEKSNRNSNLVNAATKETAVWKQKFAALQGKLKKLVGDTTN
jgi:uncharacterized protein YlxW (UPF0749 family)